MQKIAVIGCGALAHVLANAAERELAEDYIIVGFLGRNPEHTASIAQQHHAAAYRTLDELLAAKPDYVVEVAGVPAAKEYSEAVLASGTKLILVSIGSLADDVFRNKLAETAKKAGSKLYVVSGAVGGFDVMQTVSMMAPVKAVIDNEKPPENLAGAPYLDRHPLNYEKPATVFTGSVPDAIAGFPKNVNVAVASSLAAQAPDMQVIIRSTPGMTDNRHCITVENDYARAEVIVTSRPDPANPKSSSMAAWSVAALLKNLASPIMYY